MRQRDLSNMFAGSTNELGRGPNRLRRHARRPLTMTAPRLLESAARRADRAAAAAAAAKQVANPRRRNSDSAHRLILSALNHVDEEGVAVDDDDRYLLQDLQAAGLVKIFARTMSTTFFTVTPKGREFVAPRLANGRRSR